jgi:GxxExxY protein
MSNGPKENEISGDIVDAAPHVHKALGPGLLESVYETVLAHELARRGHQVERQVPISIRYENLVFEAGFKADLLVDGLVVVELKSVENVAPVHKKQTLTYVRLANKRLGLLLNFGAARMVDGITRVANCLPDDG